MFVWLGKETINVSNFCNESIKVGELGTELGIEIHCKLKFKNFIKTLCKKAAEKQEILQRISDTLRAKNKNKNLL